MILDTSLGSLRVAEILNEDKNLAILVNQEDEKWLGYLEDYDVESQTWLLVNLKPWEHHYLHEKRRTARETFLFGVSGVILELNVFTDGEQTWDMFTPRTIKLERLPT